MKKKDIFSMLVKAAKDLYNDPERLRKADAEVDSMKLEHREFIERVENLTVGDLTPEELMKMFKIIGEHVAKNKMAN